MKHLILFTTLLFCARLLQAQTYPDPEYSNEVCLLKKDNPASLLRLEKNSSKMDTKTKLGGFGGAESGYEIEGEKSTVRIPDGKSLYFIFTDGSSGSAKSSPQMDSMMKAHGVDASMMKTYADMTDPAKTITLYQVSSEKGVRKIYMMKSGGALPFASKKNKSSDKYTISVKKIREGYWELVVDKTLPKGEYAFTVMGMGVGNMDGSTTIFAFGVD